jgi:hypothetical protein
MARSRRLSESELRTYLEAQSAELERRFGVGLKPSDIERMLKNPDTLRRAIEHTARVRRTLIADQAARPATKSRLIEEAQQISTKRVNKEIANTVELVKHLLSAPVETPTDAPPPPPPRNPRGAGNKPGPYRGVLIAEMRKFKEDNPKADARAVRKHARVWFKRTYPGKVLPPRTLCDYYDIAIGGN